MGEYGIAGHHFRSTKFEVCTSGSGVPLNMLDHSSILKISTYSIYYELPNRSKFNVDVIEMLRKIFCYGILNQKCKLLFIKTKNLKNDDDKKKN